MFGFWTLFTKPTCLKSELRFVWISTLFGFWSFGFRTFTVLCFNFQDTDESIEASVDGTFMIERMAVGNIILRWFAKKIDRHTPMYNDTVYYREVRHLNLPHSILIHTGTKALSIICLSKQIYVVVCKQMLESYGQKSELKSCLQMFVFLFKKIYLSFPCIHSFKISYTLI